MRESRLSEGTWLARGRTARHAGAWSQRSPSALGRRPAAQVPAPPQRTAHGASKQGVPHRAVRPQERDPLSQGGQEKALCAATWTRDQKQEAR